MLNWLAAEVLRCELVHEVVEEPIQTLSLSGATGFVQMPDTFFSEAQNAWLDPVTLPTLPLKCVHNGVPFLYGEENSETGDQSQLGDVVGSLFFLMSRYEEAVSRETDEHCRFPSDASVLRQADLVRRAIGNEYIECLWQAMVDLWPALQEHRPQRQFRTLPSHDIDFPSAMWTPQPFLTSVRQRLSKSGLTGAAKAVARGTAYAVMGMTRNWSRDPFDTIDWIINQSEANSLQSTFFYIPESTSVLDPGMPIEHPHVADQWQRIARRGHEIGCHPGYETFDQPGRIQRGADRIRTQLESLGIQQTSLGTRQHYLRWASPKTAVACSDAGFTYDTTLAFANEPGFRCGLCYEFPMYDLLNRQPLPLRQRPLVVMDCSVVDERYLGLGTTADAFDCIQELKNTCRRFSGDFTILWHNNRFRQPAERAFYADVLRA